MDSAAKLQILDRLIFLRGKYLKLEFTLALKKKDTTQITGANRRLAKRIDELREQLHDNWTGDTEELAAKLRAVSNRLQASIRKIERNVDVARNIVKTVGYVDVVLELTGKLLKS